MYFNWLKEHNPLLKGIEFTRTRLSEIGESVASGTEEYIKHFNNKIIEDEVDNQSLSSETDNDIAEDDHNIFEQTINPIEIKDEINVQHYDSVMCNKYEHEQFDDSVVKRYAQIIIQYETVKKISNSFIDNFEQEDEDNVQKEFEDICSGITCQEKKVNLSKYLHLWILKKLVKKQKKECPA